MIVQTAAVHCSGSAFAKHHLLPWKGKRHGGFLFRRARFFNTDSQQTFAILIRRTHPPSWIILTEVTALMKTNIYSSELCLVSPMGKLWTIQLMPAFLQLTTHAQRFETLTQRLVYAILKLPILLARYALLLLCYISSRDLLIVNGFLTIWCLASREWLLSWLICNGSISRKRTLVAQKIKQNTSHPNYFFAVIPDRTKNGANHRKNCRCVSP